MIGNVVVAIIGYAAALFFVGFSATGIWIGITKPDPGIFLLALAFMALGFFIAIFTSGVTSL